MIFLKAYIVTSINLLNMQVYWHQCAITVDARGQNC